MNDQIKFSVEYRQGICWSGYYVFNKEATWHYAIFVDENEALAYAAYRQKLFDETGTSEIKRLD